MGNWRNRPPRRPYNHYRNPQYDSEIPSEFLKDNVPPWEKKFCYVVGSVPWQKVVNAKYLMSCHGNVVNWNDSAAEETFHNAKKRFWAEMNGFPCDISLPDPDIFIDEVDWNSEIDVELMKDLDRDFFAPADEESEVSNKLLRKYKRMRRWSGHCVPSTGTDSNPMMDVNSCEGEKNNTQVNNGISESQENGPSEWNNHVQASMTADNVVIQENEPVEKDNCGHDDSSENPWERGKRGFVSTKDNSWGSSCNKDWGWNRDEWNNDNSVNVDNSSWMRSSTQQQWRRDYRRWRGGGRQWGRDNNSNNQNQDSGCRQSEFGYRGSRFRVEEEYQKSRFRVEEEYRGNNKRRGWFE